MNHHVRSCDEEVSERQDGACEMNSSSVRLYTRTTSPGKCGRFKDIN